MSVELKGGSKAEGESKIGRAGLPTPSRLSPYSLEATIAHSAGAMRLIALRH